MPNLSFKKLALRLKNRKHLKIRSDPGDVGGRNLTHELCRLYAVQHIPGDTYTYIVYERRFMCVLCVKMVAHLIVRMSLACYSSFVYACHSLFRAPINSNHFAINSRCAHHRKLTTTVNMSSLFGTSSSPQLEAPHITINIVLGARVHHIQMVHTPYSDTLHTHITHK